MLLGVKHSITTTAAWSRAGSLGLGLRRVKNVQDSNVAVICYKKTIPSYICLSGTMKFQANVSSRKGLIFGLTFLGLLAFASIPHSFHHLRSVREDTFCGPAVWAINDESAVCNAASQAAIRQLAVTVSKLAAPAKIEHACEIKRFGSGWGEHQLCNKPPSAQSGCVFYSFGIDQDYSFDLHLSKDWNCRGFMLDPTVAHPARIGNNLYFFSIGATLLQEKDLGGAGSAMRGTAANKWQITSLPELKRWLGHKHINVLKMDCEGCEYALARDIAKQDPTFFHNVDQLAIEIHISKAWIKTDRHLHYLGLLYHMLKVAGLHLISSDITPCMAVDEAPGCPEFLVEAGYPCGPKKMCHNYLFSR
ncbi:uncharacterized protein SPPG_07493 [Spizellomyces punctatus DAOM BR117]|uniref:Methyltransferase domain-containing protein n=1 Tax=Spizellomyces punctatus (strain DAOM BR117) TaxID=645134 RepID=A0A0L0H843_SPIPD|nr:uncharacterized protein SPPG_07493 [Spizellomyces punctatus DAOM BR117]KNC97099.1 hypothetical protein SPPG_07493 [Spizellomyces punctatus DAOM BR117]|eukprot:XP_016605139.1 hypothetical protein SPPG_07493 [Spizellomyces punctatus DAOM BR117]